jgi:hypothetical protein
MNRAMKTLALLFFATVANVSAQYTIDWQTMDGGGGSGVAGTFAMDGTLGQLDATTGAAGSVAFYGGYWSLFDEPLPLLRIFILEGKIILAWPNPSPGFTLQVSPDLNTGSWSEVTIVPVKVGDEFQVSWGPPVGRHFFRLRRL